MKYATSFSECGFDTSITRSPQANQAVGISVPVTISQGWWHPVDGGRSEQQGVAVRRRMRDEGGGDIAARTGPVLDDEGLAECLPHLLPDDARRDVGGRAGGKPDDHADRPAGV
jgi:hypothetical protein